MTGIALRKEILLPFSGRIARNRTLKSATSERLASFDPCDEWDRGQPSEALIELFKIWGEGEIGIIVTGNIMIHRLHLESAGAIILDKAIPTDYTSSLQLLARAAKAHGSILLGQLSHPGRQVAATLQPHPVSASDIQLIMEGETSDSASHGKPRALSVEEIYDVVARFVWAARVLYKADFDGVQIHAAHGYLIGQFLSPRTNQRTDAYGGTLDNRARLLYEIVAAVRDAIPDQRFIISVKLNVADFTDDGFSLEDSLQVAESLEALRVDLIELSGGTYEGWRFHHTTGLEKEREGFFLAEARSYKQNLRKTRLAATGGFRSLHRMEGAVRDGFVDVVGMGIPLCGEPHLIKRMFSGDAPTAKPNLLPGAVVQMAAAAQQLKAVANGQVPTDYTTEKAVENWLRSAGSAH